MWVDWIRAISGRSFFWTNRYVFWMEFWKLGNSVNWIKVGLNLKVSQNHDSSEYFLLNVLPDLVYMIFCFSHFST